LFLHNIRCGSLIACLSAVIGSLSFTRSLEPTRTIFLPSSSVCCSISGTRKPAGNPRCTPLAFGESRSPIMPCSAPDAVLPAVTSRRSLTTPRMTGTIGECAGGHINPPAASNAPRTLTRPTARTRLLAVLPVHHARRQWSLSAARAATGGKPVE